MIAVTVQTSVLPHIAVAGVSCDLVMIVVLALGLSRGPEWGAIAGFAGGLMRRETSAGPVGPLGVALTVVVGAVLSLTVYSATGSLLHDPAVDWGEFGVRVGIGAGYDVVGAIVVIPLVMWVMRRVVPARERRRVLR